MAAEGQLQGQPRLRLEKNREGEAGLAAIRAREAAARSKQWSSRRAHRHGWGTRWWEGAESYEC